MIDVHGQTIVLDWGLAKSISDVEYIDSSQTSTPMFNDKTSIGVVMGTPSYMSPEQAVGDIHKMDATKTVEYFIFEPDMQSFVVFSLGDSVYTHVYQKKIDLTQRSIAATIHSSKISQTFTKYMNLPIDCLEVMCVNDE